jgi:cation transport ATPase
MNSALRKLDGVREAKASAPQGMATVEYHPGKVTPRQMIEAINATGYTAEAPRLADIVNQKDELVGAMQKAKYWGRHFSIE